MLPPKCVSETVSRANDMNFGQNMHSRRIHCCDTLLIRDLHVGKHFTWFETERLGFSEFSGVLS